MSRALLRALLPVLLAALAGGCAGLHALRPDVNALVDRWVAEHEYRKALETIAEVKPEHPQYALLRTRIPEIRRRIEVYQHEVVAQAWVLASQDKWGESLKLYDRALKQVPDGLFLRTAREQFLRERDAFVRDLELRLLISRARQLARDLPVYRQKAAALPEKHAPRIELARLEREAQRLAEALLDCGRQALKDHDSYLAQRCLGLADQLAPSEATRESLAAARRPADTAGNASAREGGGQPPSAAAQREKQRQELARRREQRSAQLVAGYRSAVANGDLLTARDLLEEAAVLTPGSEEVRKLQQALDEAIDREVQAGITEGRRRYTQGDVEGALTVWVPLQRLAPEHPQLNDYIARARRVLQNLRRIEGREPSIRLPQ